MSNNQTIPHDTSAHPCGHVICYCPDETEILRAQIGRMQDFLCERGLFQDYMDWMESHG